MPPKMKSSRSHRCDGKTCTSCTNPRVVLRPLGDPQLQTCYRYTTVPPTASLFRRPEFSDIKLKVGDDLYYAHKLILCSASDVFAKMLGSNWADSKKEMLVLEEEDECVKVFERFLKFMYSGSVIINESYVIPLFMLADKYDVQELYQECVKVIENGLKVYTAPVKKLNVHQCVGNVLADSAESSSSGSDSSDTDFHGDLEGQTTAVSREQVHLSASSSTRSSSPTKIAFTQISPSRLHLVASETFPLGMVVKLLSCCSNQRIVSASLYNLQARLSNQICHENYVIWNDLDKTLIVLMLKDDHFYCDEYVLFRAAKAWVEYDELRQSSAIQGEVLSAIRYPIMDASHLYQVENDSLVQQCEEAKKQVHQALRYKLFSQFKRPEDEDKWNGPLYKQRIAKAT